MTSLEMAHQIGSCGSNSHGQLGLNDTTDRHQFTKSGPFASAIAKLDGGANHSVALLENGQLWTCGLNDSGQIGQIARQAEEWACVALGVKDVACGWSHTVVMYSDRIVQLGSYAAEVKISGKSVAAGVQHSACIDSVGNVWMWGNNKHGQLGLSGDANEPVKVPCNSFDPPLAIGETVVQVACGQWHSLLVTSSGSVYSTGYNKFGQLGLPGIKSICKFTRINLQDAAGVRCGWSHSLAMLRNGTLYAWGRCDYGQLPGLASSGQTIPHITMPTPIDLGGEFPLVQDVQCGSEHTLLKIQNQLFVCGWNEHGNCGVNHTNDVLEPTLVSNVNPVSLVASGYGHSLIA